MLRAYKRDSRMLTRKALGLASCLCGILLATAQESTFAAEEDGFASVVAQVNSVSDLTDVDPSSWAFQSLKTVVESFGCLEGYPNKTFLGNQSLTRYEFAAGLNACLEKVAEQIAAGTTGKATKDDLLILKRLQADFSSELAMLRTRVDTLELQTKTLENRLFSTTAKLDGSVVMAITGGGASADVRTGNFSTFSFPGNGANTAFVARTSLNIRATLSGTDELLIRLRGVTGQDIGNSFSGIAGRQGTLFYAGSQPNTNGSFSYDGSALSSVSTNGSASVTFDKVRYSVNLFDDKLRIYIGPRIDLFEFIDTNSFANNEEVDFSNGFLIHNTLITGSAFAGAGLGFDWEITPNLNLRGAYIAASGGSASAFGSGGITGGNNNIVGEIEVKPSPSSSIRLQYSRSVVVNVIPGIFVVSPESGGTQGGVLFGSGSVPLPQTQSDAVGLNAEWAITPDVAIFGRFAFGWSNATSATTSIGNTSSIINPDGSIAFTSASTVTTSTTTYSETNSWSVGLSFPRLLSSPGTLGISVGQVPRSIFSSRTETSSTSSPRGFSIVFPADNLQLTSGRETDLEIFYRLPIGDRLTITPDLQLIFDPLNVAGNPIITIGTVRAVFSF
jgi:hypothetical protein